ncbi:hypothetical protein NQ318_019363 [Aromia moschata]|uniref:Ionotropic glutamate receptor C-terminal domain-containing protein n=1 Tax=Aromia moschata TaxID=1265417 RepID=A0AAV8XZH3_9CUCU|nr:hypothetical protein NQ318_019363 [Aromia moschata]
MEKKKKKPALIISNIIKPWLTKQKETSQYFSANSRNSITCREDGVAWLALSLQRSKQCLMKRPFIHCQYLLCYNLRLRYTAVKIAKAKAAYNVTITHLRFGNKTSGIDGGITAFLHNNTLDISRTGALYNLGRCPYYDYIMIPTTTYRELQGLFFFQNTGSKPIGLAILKPFTKETWFVTLGAMLVMSMALKTAYWIDVTHFNSRIRYSFFTSLLIIISILTQQGSAVVPHRLGGRIVFFGSLIFSILLYNYYTSSLVSSLLSTKPPAPKTFKDLYESDLQVGVENAPHVISYIVQMINDTYLALLNSTKIYQSSHPNYWTPKEGLEKVRQGGYAFYIAESTAYDIISRTFDNMQICNLGKVILMPASTVGLLLPKKSQYTELFQISSAMMRQGGIIKKTVGYNVTVTLERFGNTTSGIDGG